MESIIKESDDHPTGHSGPALTGALLERMELGARTDAVTLFGCREPKILHSDTEKSMIGLLCMGKPDYEAIQAFRGVPFFSGTVWGLSNVLPVATCLRATHRQALRQRLDVVNGAFDRVVKEGGASILLAASVLHYRILSIRQIKEYLHEMGVPVSL